MTYLTFPGLGHCGRMGNQLWQIASTVGMARRLGMDPLFPPDWAYRSVFSVPDEMFGTAEGPTSSDLATELEPSARPYLQHRSLWVDVEDEVLSLFQPSAYALSVLDQQTEFAVLPRPVLSVHVRRGDLVPGAHNAPWNIADCIPLRPRSYYERAVELLRHEVRSVAVFGEDPEWNRANIQADWYSELPPDNAALDWIDLFLQARCDRHVLSNSTYGVWAALLSGDKEALYPSGWYGPAVSSDAHTMLLPSWREVPAE